MSITDIQQAILVLPEREYGQLREWINELDQTRWDQQIESESKAGSLDFLIAEARESGQRPMLEEL